MPKTKNKVEDGLVLAFFKSIGVELGFYKHSDRSFRDNIESEPLYQANLDIIKQALRDGWTATELEDFIYRRYDKGERAALLSEVLPKKDPAKKLHEDDNLLQEGVDYHHPGLYDRTAPKFSVFGGVMVPLTRGSTTRKENFTLRDLTQYYFAQMRVGNVPRAWNAAVGAFQWLLQSYAVDEIMTAIDISAEVNDETPPLKIQDHINEAQREVAQRRALAVR